MRNIFCFRKVILFALAFTVFNIIKAQELSLGSLQHNFTAYITNGSSLGSYIHEAKDLFRPSASWTPVQTFTDTSIIGITTEQGGVGIYGLSLSNSGTINNPGGGVMGHAKATSTPGVYGINDAISGRGVLGRTTNNSGFGIYGDATGSMGRYGVYGHTHADSTTCYGVYGYAPAAGQESSNRTRGVYGYAAGSQSRAIYGSAWGARDPGDVSTEFCGIYGLINSEEGYGVFSAGNMGTTGTKAFIQPHPNDPEKAVRFICMEGNESGTYFRGEAMIKNKECIIDIPEEWRLVTDEAGITVQVTPHGKGRIWIAEQSRERIIIKASKDMAFNYFVNGVRRGFTNYQPIIPNTAFRPEMKNVPFATQLPEELRDMLVANGILNSDYTPNEKTAKRLGWILRGPDDPEYPPTFKTQNLKMGVPYTKSTLRNEAIVDIPLNISAEKVSDVTNLKIRSNN